MAPEMDVLPTVSDEQLGRFLTMLVIARNIAFDVHTGIQDGSCDDACAHLLNAADDIQEALGLMRQGTWQRGTAGEYAPLAETLRLLAVAAKHPHGGETA